MQKYNLFSVRKRITGLIVLVSFLFCALAVRLFVVQIINGTNLQVKATDQWIRDLPLVAERGKIIDSTGSTLAVSYTTYNVYTRGREIEDATAVTKYLCELLDLRFGPIYDKVIEKGVSEMLIKMQVEENIAKQIYAKGYKGVFLSENINRYYPYGDLLTQILGFTTIDNVGQAGIEAYFNDYLKGTDGSFYVQSDIQGREIANTLSSYFPSVSGMNIALTVDSKIQLALEQALELIMVEQQAKGATGIIMNPNTGEIIALSSKPSFDLNNIPRTDVLSLMDMTKNKAVIDVYEPGSTFKILTMSAALDSGLADLDDRFYCSGNKVVDGQKIKCWRSIGHGSQDLTEGFCNSCNVEFMDLALRMGTGKFYDYLESFGLGKKTGITVSGEAGGILMKESAVKNVDLARIGFGHAVAVTPIQLLTACSAAVNGGKLMEPYIIKDITDSNGKTAVQYQPKTVKKVVGASTSKTINEMLEAVLSKTGKNTFVPGYSIGGKTGTAQKYENGVVAQGKYISSFIGTYPAANPEYIMLIMVDEPGAGAYYGSIVASPYAKLVFEGIFEYKNIAPETDVVLKDVVMPEIRGLSLAEAIARIVKLNLNYEIDGEGTMVTGQIAPAGVTLKEGDTVVIITN